MPILARTVLLLAASNVFMTFAWYGHLGSLRDWPLWIAIGVSWGIAFFEYCLQVPANRIGYGAMSLGQLKVLQEVITMIVFMAFAHFYSGGRSASISCGRRSASRERPTSSFGEA